MNRLADKIHILILRALRKVIHVTFFLPIKQNRILFTSYLGESYSCNPKYISEYLQAEYSEKYEIVWAFKDVDRFRCLKGIKCIPYKSLKWLYYQITAKVVIGNNGAVWIPRRKGQLIIDTWHGGGCYKKVALDRESTELANYRTRISGHEVNLYLSSSKYFSEEVVRKSFMFSGEILPSGMPRNDILFENGDVRPKKELREEIAGQYSFDPGKYIVLFAPTWRKGSQRVEPINVAEIEQAVLKRFGKEAVVLGRGHHSENGILEEYVTDVTSYPDMQELLVVADMLITDYSSSIWDYSFTGKPCFLFTPDLETYRIEPGFDCDIYSWGFPVCNSNGELAEAIEQFDPIKHVQNMRNHHNALTNYDDGHASQKVCEYINKFCEGN